MYISHSAVELYSTCPHKYYLMKVEKWAPDQTHAALLFGLAVDRALNYCLLRKKHAHDASPETAIALFNHSMSSWKAQNELVYFKNEAPQREDFDDLSEDDKQFAVWTHLKSIGHTMIHTYINNILPQLGTILSVQTKRFIPNEAGDNLILVTDFRAQLPDGRTVTFDNKTASDLKKYGPSSVKKSHQLAIYTEFEPSRLAGYIALSKRDGTSYVMRIDEIEEPMVDEAFSRVDEALNAIKAKDFPKNEKSCWAFGRLCEMHSLCKKGSTKGLIKR